MAITKEQLISIGFKPSKRSKIFNSKKYDTLIYVLNKTDYIYTGYNNYSKKQDYKRLWKTFQHPETKEIITYPIDKIGELSYNLVLSIIAEAKRQSELKEELYEGNKQSQE